jgi:hypothetical protein
MCHCKLNYNIFVNDFIYFSDQVIGVAPNPIFFYEMDLEPLNKMITDFVNKPGGFLADYL